ncbi:5-bromo-4-chloroindolyl phosphate hydrolysis family protein [Alkalilacustris brevis]|uniref:5-bromo-4-chloroindolyl phosphate hydrolysis family protein n=1 Tax=Alkalilacustris brevis TaxID=2026338 RepID=UPI000E0D3770|nr:5-bromo-4-chloroindolyl phosphate hydrolysis family protein [Alkalilacustris brevis]
MARRIGGKYSPPRQGADSAPPVVPRPSRIGARANLMFLLPLPFAITAFLGTPAGMALDLLAFGVLMLSAWLTREGLRAEEAYDARRVAKRPAIPRKIFGSGLMGLGLALGGYAPGGDLAAPVIFALFGAALHFISFGPDPLQDKGTEGLDSFQTDRVARAVTEAEAHLAAIQQHIRALGDRRLADRVADFSGQARVMFRAVEDDPRSLTAARRYLGVYLLGARDATEKFAALYARRSDAQARQDYEALLSDLQENFAARTEALLANDRTALDIEMEVLRERLAREGLRPEAETDAAAR